MRLRIPSVVVPFVLSAATACAQIEDKHLSNRAAPSPDSPVSDQKVSDSTTASTAGKPPLREHHTLEGVSPAKSAQPSNPRSGEDLLQRLGRDLAQRLGVTPPALQVLSVESVVWDDGSLGCPQPDQFYTSAQVPGMRVLFAHEGKTYQYHASERGHFVYCPNPAVPAVGEYDRQ